MTRYGMGTRRAALDGLARIMDATALEELFTGSDEDALMMFDLLSEVARGRQARCYWEVCRTARRRGVTPEYVADRAAVLLSSIEERRRSDVYRILGVEPLASDGAIRQRWLEIAKAQHPDVGGDAERFRRAKEAYDLLKDPAHRAEYERYWLRALGPFERVAPAEDEAVGPAVVVARDEASAAATNGAPVGAGDGDGAPAAAAGTGSFDERLAQVRAAVAAIDALELGRTQEAVAERIQAIERIRDDLRTVAALKRTFPES